MTKLSTQRVGPDQRGKYQGPTNLMSLTSSGSSNNVARFASVVSRPGVMGGSPIIATTRIRVSDVIRHQRLRGDALLALPFLTREQVTAALEYYSEHQGEVDQEIEEEETLAAQWRGSI